MRNVQTGLLVWASPPMYSGIPLGDDFRPAFPTYGWSNVEDGFRIQVQTVYFTSAVGAPLHVVALDNYCTRASKNDGFDEVFQSNERRDTWVKHQPTKCVSMPQHLHQFSSWHPIQYSRFALSRFGKEVAH